MDDKQPLELFYAVGRRNVMGDMRRLEEYYELNASSGSPSLLERTSAIVRAGILNTQKELVRSNHEDALRSERESLPEETRGVLTSDLA